MDTSTLLSLWSNATSAQLLAPIFVVSLVAALCLMYGIHYFFRSFLISGRLKKLTRQIRAAGEIAPAQRRKELEQLFNGHVFKHVWSEYAETLHNQYELRDGEQRLLRSRAVLRSGQKPSTNTGMLPERMSSRCMPIKTIRRSNACPFPL